MKSTKKVRTQQKPSGKITKKTAKKVAKIKLTGMEASSKKVTKTKPVPKITKAGKAAQSSVAAQRPKPKSVAKGKTSPKSANKNGMMKRKNRELTQTEYDAFVIKTAQEQQVRPEELVTVDRRRPSAESVIDSKPEIKAKIKADPRPKAQRRRQIDPTTCERDYTLEEVEFMNALDEYKRNSGRMFPTCSEILEVFRGLGYIKQTHEESIEINANPESGDVYIIATETSALSREKQELEPKKDIPPILPFGEDSQNAGTSGYQSYTPISTPFFL